MKQILTVTQQRGFCDCFRMIVVQGGISKGYSPINVPILLEPPDPGGGLFENCKFRKKKRGRKRPWWVLRANYNKWSTSKGQESFQISPELVLARLRKKNVFQLKENQEKKVLLVNPEVSGLKPTQICATLASGVSPWAPTSSWWDWMRRFRCVLHVKFQTWRGSAGLRLLAFAAALTWPSFRIGGIDPSWGGASFAAYLSSYEVSRLMWRRCKVASSIQRAQAAEEDEEEEAQTLVCSESWF